MKRPRPHVPIWKRVIVAQRQARKFTMWDDCYLDAATSDSERLERCLAFLFTDRDGVRHRCHLDHHPPLGARKFNPRTGKYTPDANDVDHLYYRLVEDHRIKTFVRGEHGQYSDRALIKRERRRLKRRARPKRKWPTREIPSRPFR